MNKKQIAVIALCLLCIVCVGIVFATMADVEAATVLKAGSRGETVKKLQTKLKNWGYYSGSVDGVFGANTTKAVKAFQRANKLTADGVVGNATAKKLGLTLGGSTSSGSNTSGSGDIYLLARCIYGEARGESYTGKVAVGAVVLNRVRSKSFPNTISGVIYQPWAFTAVNDGQINMGTDDECLRAAQDAMNGWDPTYGSIYYYNPRTATNEWIRGRKIVATIGKHVFCV